jgi:hypothetical protein
MRRNRPSSGVRLSGASPLALRRLKTGTAHENSKGREDRRVDLISGSLQSGRLWYGGPNAIPTAVDYAKFYGRSHDAVIRVYDDAGNVIKTHEHAGDFKEGEFFSPNLSAFVRR